MARGERHASSATRVRAVLRVARAVTTACSLLIIAIATSRVVADHHVTLAGLRHLTPRHAVHTALVELGLRPRQKAPASPTDAVATVGADTIDASPGNN